MHVCPRTVRLNPDVAELLSTLRKPGESWSDVIKRCATTEKEAQASEKGFLPKKVVGS